MNVGDKEAWDEDVSEAKEVVVLSTLVAHPCDLQIGIIRHLEHHGKLLLSRPTLSYFYHDAFSILTSSRVIKTWIKINKFIGLLGRLYNIKTSSLHSTVLW